MNTCRRSTSRNTSAWVAGLAILALMGSSCSGSNDGAEANSPSPSAAVASEDSADVPDAASSPVDDTGDVDASAGSSVDRPADFPADLPLPDGANASLTGGAGYYSYSVDLSAGAAAQAIDAMIAAGYEALLREESGGAATARLNNGEYEVVATYQEGDGGSTTLGLSIYPSR